MPIVLIIPAGSYAALYYGVMGLFCFCVVCFFALSEGNKFSLSNGNHFILALALSLALVVYLGIRPISGRYFGDMSLYAWEYENIYDSKSGYSIVGLERFWVYISRACRQMGLSTTSYFIVIAFLYVAPMLASCKHLKMNNLLIAALFCFMSFSFWGYAVNGMRNGVACSFMMLAIALLVQKKNLWIKVVGAVFVLLAYNTHHSTVIPIAAVIVTFTFVRKPKMALAIWLLCIPLSLIAGGSFETFFGEFFDDDRAAHYLIELTNNKEIMDSFSSTGFRFDFLLYSSMPVLMICYVTVKRNFQDKVYSIIANTYLISNAFWILVIRAPFSNRFAYLSWFLYPLVVSYPMLKYNIWEDQDRKTAVLLALYSSFTLYMFFRE